MSAVFEVVNLKKSFGGLAVTNNVSISMAPGDRVALIGPNGAGKTTFVTLVTGKLAPDSGEVRLGGETVTGFEWAAAAVITAGVVLLVVGRQARTPA